MRTRSSSRNSSVSNRTHFTACSSYTVTAEDDPRAPVLSFTMFARKPRQSDSFSSKYGAGKSSARTKRSFREHSVAAGLQRSESLKSPQKEHTSPPIGRSVQCSPLIQNTNTLLTLSAYSTLTSAIITLCVGPEQRLFASHEDVLCQSPFFQAACRGQFLEAHSKRIDLPEEQPEILSSVLEYLYKGDYYPKLLHNKRKDTWELEDGGANGANGATDSTIYHHAVGTSLLKDTVI